MKIRIDPKYSLSTTTFHLIKITDNALFIIKTVKFDTYPNLGVEPSYTVVIIKEKASTDIWAAQVSDVIGCRATFPWTRLEEKLVKKYQNLLTKRINMLFYFAKRERRRRLCNG